MSDQDTDLDQTLHDMLTDVPHVWGGRAKALTDAEFKQIIAGWKEKLKPRLRQPEA